ncbi:1581_t:CDS:2, partial [Funneliformis caledonium]
CISLIELIREELSLASGEYHIVSKNKDFRKKDTLSDDTIEDEDSLAGQGGKRTEVTTHDQATSPIVIDNSTNQTTEDDIANTQIQSSRETSQEPIVNRKDFE